MGASYPTAAKTFTTKNAGDTIQPAHINDLQDEVAAIEDGLLNGIAPLNSSNSTLANLSVPGLSTLTGDVTMAGTLTVNKIVSTSLGTAGVTTYVRAYAGSVSEYGTGSTGTKLAYDQRTHDLSSEYDSTTYTFTPKSSGYYQICARLVGLTGGPLNEYLQLWVNDTLVAYGAAVHGNAESAQGVILTTVQQLSSGAAGACQVRAYASSTARASSGLGTSMEIIKLF